MQNHLRKNITLIGKNPHRFPMVLIDRIIYNDESVVTEKFISLNDYEFRHSDFMIRDDFIYPNWLVIESFFQSAGLFLHCQEKALSPYLISCKNIDVRRNIYGGEIVRHYVTLNSKKESFIIVSGESKVDCEIVISYQQVWLGTGATPVPSKQ